MNRSPSGPVAVEGLQDSLGAKIIRSIDQEQIRNSFRPNSIKLLFIGEAPPASGRFFYCRNSGLFRAMRDAFQLADRSINGENFLSHFKASGYYLIDLCASPVDQLNPPERRLARKSAVPTLATKISELRPLKIATLLRSIESDVLHAIAMANWKGPILHLPYPGRWIQHKKAFNEALQSDWASKPSSVKAPLPTQAP